MLLRRLFGGWHLTLRSSLFNTLRLLFGLDGLQPRNLGLGGVDVIAPLLTFCNLFLVLRLSGLALCNLCGNVVTGSELCPAVENDFLLTLNQLLLFCVCHNSL